MRPLPGAHLGVVGVDRGQQACHFVLGQSSAPTPDVLTARGQRSNLATGFTAMIKSAFNWAVDADHRP